MKIFVLSLDRAKQRRAFMQSQLERLRLDFEFIRGTDYREMSEDDFHHLCSQRATADNPYVRSVFACALSHLAILRSGLSHALILEDDVALSEDLPTILQQVEQHCLPGRVILLCYYTHQGVPLSLTRLTAQTVDPGVELLSPSEIASVGSGAAYIITRDIAERMLKRLMPVDHAADNWGHFHALGIFRELYCLHPRLAKEAHFPTSISYPGARTAKHRLISFLRRLDPFERLAIRIGQKRLVEKYRIDYTDAPPFWNRGGKDRDGAGD